MTSTKQKLSPAVRRMAIHAALVAGAAFLSACSATKQDSVTVGAVPEDYRTNHPITIAEREAVYDVPVAGDATGLSLMQKQAVSGFIANYDRSSGAGVKVMVPQGSANADGANRVAGDIVQLLSTSGIPAGRIMTYSYDAGQHGPSAPVRIAYSRLSASTGKCGRWGADLADNTENRHWQNFGCSYQTNLAAQVANPADLLGPRQPGEIDGTRRSTVIDDYETGKSAWNPTTDF